MTYKIAGAVCAPTANTLPVVHIVVEAHWIDLIGDGHVVGKGDGDLLPCPSLCPAYGE